MLDDEQAAKVAGYLARNPEAMSRLERLPPDRILELLRQAQAETRVPAAEKDDTADDSSPAVAVPEDPPREHLVPNLHPELASLKQYRFLRQIGAGGMSVVYKAENLSMGRRREAIKTLNEIYLQHEGGRARFRQEIAVAAGLTHPNIVTAYSVHELPSMLVFAMEFIDGQDLEDVIANQGPLKVSAACAVIRQAATALQYAHEGKTVHRDIKPANLMLARSGGRRVVKILDFGLAKAQRENENGTRLTSTGSGMGTPHYMAPEQLVSAGEVDIRADIYSLGCTLYFLLSGQTPFRGTTFEVYQAHQSGTATPLTEIRSDVPAELAEVVARAMAKSPADRFQQPSEFAEALGQFVTVRGSGSPQSGSPHSGASRAVVREHRHPDSGTSSPASQPRRLSQVKGSASRPVEPTQLEILPPTSRTSQVQQVVTSAARSAVQSARSIEWTNNQILAATAGTVLLLSLLTVVLTTIFRGNGDQPADGASRGSTADIGTTTDQSADGASRESIQESQTAESGSDPFLGSRAGEVRLFTDLNVPMCWCPAGSFVMGSPLSEPDRDDDDESQVNVTLSQGFWLGQSEVTQGQWSSVMQSEPWSGKDYVQSGWTYPAVYVSHGLSADGTVEADSAVEFCRRLTSRERSAGRLPDGWQYTLPTEAQWEYACRASTDATADTTPYSFVGGAERLGDYAWYNANASSVEQEYAHAVMQKRPNAWGLHDMHGNVWEWCQDTYNVALPGGRDPVVLSAVSFRVVRGGSWYLSAWDCRSANRGGFDPSFRCFDLGFRLSLSPSGK